MTSINWGQKLGSRKFWALLAALVTSALVLLRVNAETSTQIVALIGAFGAIVMYMFAEASVDRARADGGDPDVPTAILLPVTKVGEIGKDPVAQTPQAIKPPDAE